MVDSRNPYYIHAPRYIRSSGGIRTLHHLCDRLNRMGAEAFLHISYSDDLPDTRADLDCPLLTPALVEKHRGQGLRPIVVYPEVVDGNPLGADCVVRYLLNYAGVLGGPARFPSDDYIVAFSNDIAAAYGDADMTLHLPTIDTEVFRPLPVVERSGTAFYAFKLRNVHRQEVSGLPPGAVEITRDRPDSPSPAEIAELFRRSELFYCFENSALVTEAVLCGCPAVLMPNAHFDRSIGVEELGWDGYAWGDAPEEIARARATVEGGRQNYFATVAAFDRQLEAFVAATQARAAAGPPAQIVLPPREIGRFPADVKFGVGPIARYAKTAGHWRARDGWRLVWIGLRTVFSSVIRRRNG